MTDVEPPKVPPPPVEPIVESSQKPNPAQHRSQPGAKRMSLPKALDLAGKLEAQGQLHKSEQILRQIIRVQPEHAGALHLLSVVSHRQGQSELALQLISRAIAKEPNNALLHSNFSEISRVVGKLEQAISSGKQAIELNPSMPAPLSNVGIAYYDLKDYENAEAFQQRALAIDPNFAAALNNLGSIKRQNKDRNGAIESYRRVLEINPEYLEAMNNLGAVLVEDERFEEAVKVLIQAFRKRPDYTDVHCNLGFAFLGLEDFDRARQAFEKAIELRATYTEAYLGLARLHQEQNRLDEARTVARKAKELEPEKSEVHSVLGTILTESGFPDQAQQSFDEALRIDPESLRALVGYGALQMELGDLQDAEATFEKALAIDPASMAARVSLTHVKKSSADDENLQAITAELSSNKNLSRVRATSLNYAVGKCYDDIGDYDKAFAFFSEGAKGKRGDIEYDADDQALLISNLISFSDAETLQRLSGGGHSSDLPIFVLGMARSGTTLTEQIIASHPDVFGAGELPDMLDLAREPRGPEAKTPFPHSMQHLTQADLGVLGERYVNGLRERNADARRITDKMPANYLAVGLIHLMLPNARIVHVKRNPADTCLSCYSRLFNNGQAHTYDLAELGAYYRGYARLMEHWHEVLPEGTILDVVYEDLVADNEAQARRLIEFCGLEWNDACLQFHKHERSIRTASVTQVRQPIYNSSVARWKRYERHLEPLLTALGDLSPAN